MESINSEMSWSMFPCCNPLEPKLHAQQKPSKLAAGTGTPYLPIPVLNSHAHPSIFSHHTASREHSEAFLQPVAEPIICA